MRSLLKMILGQRGVRLIRRMICSPGRIASPYFKYDMHRFVRHSGAFSLREREQLRAYVIMQYHIIEKGLTMPNRHLPFGKDVVEDMMGQISLFEKLYGADDQIVHAIGVLKAYWDIHCQSGICMEGEKLWDDLRVFLGRHESVAIARQPHVTKEEFYRNKELPFPAFATSRHTLRHYSSKPVDIEKLRAAVSIAISAPSACNRQHCRVYCVSDKEVMSQILAIQGGSRGFGHLSDKLLIVTANLEDLSIARERDDVFINGGIFLMNLCYALFYYEIAHCILNWSRLPEEDIAARKLVKIRDSETIIAILTCGSTPDEFDVCSSPRKSIDELFVEL